MKKRHYINEELKNLEMNNKVYKLRRQVMDLIYEANSLVKLPRITVRITENYGSVVGRASYNTNVIWIPKRSMEESKNTLRWIVFHEILHTVYGIRHKKTGLMTSYIKRNISKEEVHRLFLKEIK